MLRIVTLSSGKVLPECAGTNDIGLCELFPINFLKFENNFE